MVNPYAESGYPAPKSQIRLGQSQLLKKIEKLQTKHSLDRSTNKKSNLDSSNEDNDEDEEEDSVFKNLRTSSNKFIKKKDAARLSATGVSKRGSGSPKSPRSPKDTKRPSYKPDLSDSSDSDLEISAEDRSSTPNRKDSTRAATQRNLSTASSIYDYPRHHRRSPSKVKFQDKHKADSEDEEESTIIEDMLSKNLVLDINELEASISADQSMSDRKQRQVGSRKSEKFRSESVASVIEEDEDRFSSIHNSSLDSRHSLRNAKLILDIDELEQSFDSRFLTQDVKGNSKKRDKEVKRSPKSTSSKRKSFKRVKTPCSIIETDPDLNDMSIHTEIETEATKTEERDEIKTVKSNVTYSDIKAAAAAATMTTTTRKSYRDDFETSLDTTELSASNRFKRKKKFSASEVKEYDKNSEKKNKKKDKKKKKKRNSSTSSDASGKSSSRRGVVKAITSRMAVSNAEIQVDPSDILKHSDLYKSVGTCNPSSLIISSLTYLNDSTNLNDLNQLTGFNMINQTYSDLIRMNLNFFRNFLTVQRSLYQQQVNSIKPK